LPNFTIRESGNFWEIYLEDGKVKYHKAKADECFDLNQSWLDISKNDLVRWLDRELHQADIKQVSMIKFVQLIVDDLLSRSDITLTALVRNKYPLAKAIRELISRCRMQAQSDNYQHALFASDAQLKVANDLVYEFNPTHYPAKPPFYSGSYRFQKHYYGNNRIEDISAKGEEFECARAIDTIDEVKYWIRNLVRREHGSFWLPLAHGKFYPDFVVELNDGRMLVVEYKGAAYATNDDSKEKNLVGELWAENGGDNYLFLMAVDKKIDPHGRDTRTQILHAIEKN
jgi:type III restriction enzyme